LQAEKRKANAKSDRIDLPVLWIIVFIQRFLRMKKKIAPGGYQQRFELSDTGGEGGLDTVCLPGLDLNERRPRGVASGEKENAE
jgi:hypothetical protein